VGKLDEGQYELVLSDLQMESPQAGLKVLAHAKMMDYKPATAIITTYQSVAPRGAGPDPKTRSVLIEPEDIPSLLGKVADLLGQRVGRRIEREMRLAGV